MPKGGLEPPHLAAPVPETGVSTISPPGQVKLARSIIGYKPAFVKLNSTDKAPWVEQVVGIKRLFHTLVEHACRGSREPERLNAS